MLTEHIKNVLNGQPVYEIEIPYVEGAMQDLLFPPSESSVVFEDSDHLPAKGCDVIVIGNEMKSTQPDNLNAVEFIMSPDAIAKRIVDDQHDELCERIASGEYDPDGHDFQMPAGFVDRIRDLLKRREKALKEKMVWFTFGLDGRDCYSSWPVAAYHFGACNQTCYNEPKVAPALLRLMKRDVIQGIRVTGPIPQHWYFGTINHSE